MQELILLPEEESIGERADKYLAVQLPQHSRSFFQKLFRKTFRWIFCMKIRISLW